MKDIDFDELDRAVNSVIQNTQPTVVSDNNSSDNSVPVIKNIDAKPSMPMHPSILARRSNGRFMDMVPLSASTRNNTPNPARITRQGIDIIPQNSPVNKPVAINENNALVDNQPSATEQENNIWPDPINNQILNQGVEVVNEDDGDADIDQINADIENTLNPKNDEALESPFISGTKVEKRPLNALSADETDDLDSKVDDINNSTNEPNVIDTGSFNTNMPLPAELGDDLLSIESGASIPDELAQPADSSAVAPETIPVNQEPAVSVPSNPIVSNDSIVQQYQEQPSSGDQTSAAIYDTNAYHKAVVKPPKGKSGWLWIIWILLLIAVGAGVGAAVFFLMPGF